MTRKESDHLFILIWKEKKKEILVYFLFSPTHTALTFCFSASFIRFGMIAKYVLWFLITPHDYESFVASICFKICFSKTVLCTCICASFSGVPFCFVVFKRLEEPPKKGLKNGRRAFSTVLLIDEMFPLPLQLFSPFSLENSQWHPVRFASWFICHISFISLNSLYLSSGPMHLSWAPQQCLEARSKHILHVTLQLQLAYFTLGV